MFKQIMIVDDSPTALKLISLMLERNGFSEVIMAEDAEEALELLETLQPDLFIVDVIMPGMNGFELCKEIRCRPETSRTPVIVVSALGDPNSAMASFEAGANDYLSKPIIGNSLVSKVRTMLN